MHSLEMNYNIFFILFSGSWCRISELPGKKKESFFTGSEFKRKPAVTGRGGFITKDDRPMHTEASVQ